MPSLSEHARVLLARMEPDHQYEPQDLRALVPDAGVETLRELMHELWVNRHVERVGYSGWRRHQSAAPHAPRSVARHTGTVRPEDLFDHTAFAEFFK